MRDKLGRFIKGYKWTTEEKIKRSNRIKGKNNPMFGKKHTLVTKEKISLKKIGKTSPRKGVVLSKITRNKISFSKLGKYKGDGRIKTKSGYIKVHNLNHPMADRGMVYEHRLVMEKTIGRYLHRWEVVHHINEQRDDNRIQNLKIMSIPAHTKLHCEGKICKT